MLVVCETSREVENLHPVKAFLTLDYQSDVSDNNGIPIEPGHIILVALLVFLVILAVALAVKFRLRRRAKLLNPAKKAPMWRTPPVTSINSTT